MMIIINNFNGHFLDHLHIPQFFLDIMDDFNQRTQQNDNRLPNDNVKGYTITQLSKLLPKITGMLHLRNEVKKIKSTAVTDAQIDDLFTIFFNYKQ